MRIGLAICLYFTAVSVGWAQPSASISPSNRSQKPVVILPEDELVLPPLLQRFSGGNVLNVTSIKNKKRSLKEGEWLEYGDYFSLSDRMSLQVIMRENLQWVGGGVFQGHLGQRKWNEADSPYELLIERGWIKVWAKANERTHVLRVTTKNTVISSDDAEFWLTTRPGRTEVYLIQGMIADSKGQKFKERRFYLWDGEQKALQSSSKAWDEGAMEVQLAALYPSFVKLADRAEKDWRGGESESAYARLRSKGWRKASRLEPDPAAYPPRASATPKK